MEPFLDDRERLMGTRCIYMVAEGFSTFSRSLLIILRSVSMVLRFPVT